MDYLTILESNLPNIDAADALGLRRAIAAMVAACVAPTQDRENEAANIINLTRMERAPLA